MRRQLLPAVRALLVLSLVCGLAYPLLLTGVAGVLFPDLAAGSLLRVDGRVVGSDLLGQSFTGDRYLHPRPSAAGDGYDGAASSGSNLGPSNPGLAALVAERTTEYRRTNGLDPAVPVPVDAVTASGSGLDPHVSIANARLQAPRIARSRGLPLATVLSVIEDHTTRQLLGFLGDQGVHVLSVNVALDALS